MHRAIAKDIFVFVSSVLFLLSWLTDPVREMSL